MIFRQCLETASSTYTYLLACEQEKLAVLIDPVLSEVEHYLSLLSHYDLRLHTVLDTHIHADHITASGALKSQTGAQIAMDSHSEAAGVDRLLHDGDTVEVGSLKITSLYTPGHTAESACFLMPDRIFTGDTLLINGTGRTDFQNGSSKESYHSIINKLFTLADETLLYPGHDYKGRRVSSIGEARDLNPRLAGKTENEYIEIMDNLNLPNPKQLDVAVPANLRCGVEA